MTEQERNLVIDYAGKRISEAEFLARFPVNPREDLNYATRALQETLQSRNKDDVECAMILGFVFGFPPESVDVLCNLILEDWHTQHENMAWQMQRMKDPRAIDCLYKTALVRFPYLAYDEVFALGVKCAWALYAINTAESREKLRLLTQCDNEIIRKQAERLLKRIAEESARPGDASQAGHTRT